MLLLKVATAVTVKIGPFLDSTDGNTAETGLTISQADVRLSNNGGNIAQKNGASACTHDELGIYDCPLDDTDTGTLGRLQLWVHESGALPVWHEFMVVPAVVYDALVGGSDYLQVDAVQVEGGDATDALAAAPPSAATIAAAVWDEASTGHVDAGKAGAQLWTDVDAILADTAELQAELADGGRTDLLIDAIKAKTDNLPADPADDSDIDTQLAAIAGYLDTEVAAILAAVDTEVAAILADTAELQAELADGGRTDLLIDAILADTNELQTDDVPGLIAALNDLSAAEVNAEVDAALAGYDPPTKAELDAGLAALNDPSAATIAAAVWDEASTGHVDAGKAGAQLWTDIDAILADTAELQAELANGGRTDLLIDAILTDTNELQAELADGGRTDLLIDAILADTNELQTDDVPGLIAALNDPSAADVADAVLDEAVADHAGAGSVGAALKHLDADVSSVGGAAGAGAITFVYTLTSSVGGAPIAQADVWVTTDQAGTNVVASGQTDNSGQVTFYLDAGTYYVWRQKSGYNFTNPDTETVA